MVSDFYLDHIIRPFRVCLEDMVHTYLHVLNAQNAQHATTPCKCFVRGVILFLRRAAELIFEFLHVVLQKTLRIWPAWLYKTLTCFRHNEEMARTVYVCTTHISWVFAMLHLVYLLVDSTHTSMECRTCEELPISLAVMYCRRQAYL